jgi:hypothetical protein
MQLATKAPSSSSSFSLTCQKVIEISSWISFFIWIFFCVRCSAADYSRQGTYNLWLQAEFGW